MAITPQERADIRSFLGWPAAFYEASDALEQAIDNISQSRPNDEVLVRKTLADIRGLDDLINESISVANFSTKVGSIEQRGDYHHRTLITRGKNLIQRLANFFGVAVQGGYFDGKPAPFIEPREGNAGSYELVEG